MVLVAAMAEMAPVFAMAEIPLATSVAEMALVA